MIIYPAIDLIDGHCVRLQQGDFTRQTHYQHDPLALACDYRRQGAEWLHLVDLDAAANPQAKQSASISRIAATCGLKVQVGGGIRSREHADHLLEMGCTRVVIGSLVVTQPRLAEELLTALGPERVVFAFDVQYREQSYYLCNSGWREQSSLELFTTLGPWVERGLRHLLCTDISRDGTLAGPHVQLYQQLSTHHPLLAVQASGGVAELADFPRLRQAGVAGVITGKALLEGRFSLHAALQSSSC